MAALFELIYPPTHYSTQSALNELTLESLILVEWRGKFTPQQIYTWHLRTNQKKHIIKLTLPVAVALWTVLQQMPIPITLQELLSDLTTALVNAGLRPNYLTYNHHD